MLGVSYFYMYDMFCDITLLRAIYAMYPTLGFTRIALVENESTISIIYFNNLVFKIRPFLNDREFVQLSNVKLS